jgi:hypothetical protein
LPETNTLAYYENPQNTAIKSFIVQAPGPVGYGLPEQLVHWLFSLTRLELVAVVVAAAVVEVVLVEQSSVVHQHS